MLTVVLASTSPRRRDLLASAGIPHRVQPADIPEQRLTGETPIGFVRRLAREKAESTDPAAGEAVLGADTVVCVGDEVFGKPVDDLDAARMLRALSGRWHSVLTGICLRFPDRVVVDHAETRVSVLQLDDNEIWEYIRTGEPRDKAGAYAIQGFASKYIDAIEGSYQNVVGLPVSLVYRYLSQC